ncbi:FkbM family methyltransferase [candidate division KSB1 bacterium]
MKILKKIKREVTIGLSKLCLKKTRVNYLGLDLKVPVLYGMGSGYFVPAELWMGDCMKIFLEQKEGAVIDIGANVGVYLVKLRVWDRERSYYGFEPNQACTFYCQELIRMNKFRNSFIFPFALSDNPGIRTLHAKDRSDKGGTIHLFAKDNTENLDYSFDAAVMQGDSVIDTLDLDKMSVIKVDVEGAELEVLAGLKGTIGKFRPFIYCEILLPPHESDPAFEEIYRRRDQIFRLLLGLDYTIIGRTHSGELTQINNAEELDNKFDENFICSPKENLAELTEKLKLIE